MESIALPKKIEYQPSAAPNRGKVIIEPFFPGYGTTLGNSLRRVLLSSLPGAAPIGVKIDKVEHEFMTLPHLKEDILEFILNLKQLRLKVFSDEVVKLSLKVHGKKEIKAQDIEKNSNVEIVNPELVLGTITDMAGSMQAEIYVAKGMGYQMIENREGKDKEINYIEMDSIFSPVISAGIKLENVRVGKMTNWDRLILDIETDSTITPKEAFDQAVKVLIKQYQALVGGVEAKEESEKIEEEKDKKATKEDNKKTAEKEEDEKDEEPTSASSVQGKKKRGRPKKSE